LRFGFFQKLREAIAALYHALSRGRVRIRVTGGATGAFSASIFLWRPVQRATTLVEVRVILPVWQQARRMLWRSATIGPFPERMICNQSRVRLLQPAPMKSTMRVPLHPVQDIETHEVSDEFARCWQAAGLHIQTKGQGHLHSWLKGNLNPPFLEHLSFRLGNQLFFIRSEDVDERLHVPGSRNGLLYITQGCQGHPCIMPMRFRAGAWAPDAAGWGLIDPRNGKTVDPIAYVSDERIEMTDWELQDFAVQIVRDHLEKAGRRLTSWQGNPAVDPSIWFVGDSGPEWVVVRAVRYPKTMADLPTNWQQIAARCANVGKVGHFASVSAVSANDTFDPAGPMPHEPLWRGHGMFVRFEGLETHK
jgi:hypothetical protein